MKSLLGEFKGTPYRERQTPTYGEGRDRNLLGHLKAGPLPRQTTGITDKDVKNWMFASAFFLVALFYC